MAATRRVGALEEAYEAFVDTFQDSLNLLTDTMTAYHLEGEALDWVRTGK